MIADFFLQNFLTLMLLVSLLVMLIINHKLAVPATGYFFVGIVLQLVTCIVNTFNAWADQDMFLPDQPELRYRILIITTVLQYTLRPVIIMIVAFIVISKKTFCLPCMIPTVVNAIVYSWMGFGGRAGILLDKHHPWHREILGVTFYITEIFYLFLLLLFSVIYFKRDHLKQSALVLVISIQSILVVFLENLGLGENYSDVISTICMIEYYFYLSLVYQNKMQNEISKRELMLAESKLAILRTQIHPHFILNSLSIIRSLVKRDSQKSIECIDAFADYLNVHIRAIRHDDVIDFEKELRHVKAYLSLVLADNARQIDIQYDLQVMDFKIPPLTLEPLIENAVKYGTGKENSFIRISTEENGQNEILILVEDSGGSGKPRSESMNKSTGVGITNTRLRLSLQCGGSLKLEQQSGGGMLATIQIPRIQEAAL